MQDFIWIAPLLAIIPLLLYGTLLFGVVYGLLHQQFLLAGVSTPTLVIHYVALLLMRPGNKFNAIVALAFPLMSVQFAASCLRATYLLTAKGMFEWRGRNTNLNAARNAVAERSDATKQVAGRLSNGESSPPAQSRELPSETFMKFTLSNLLLGVAVVPVPPGNLVELPIQA